MNITNCDTWQLLSTRYGNHVRKLFHRKVCDLIHGRYHCLAFNMPLNDKRLSRIYISNLFFCSFCCQYLSVKKGGMFLSNVKSDTDILHFKMTKSISGLIYCKQVTYICKNQQQQQQQNEMLCSKCIWKSHSPIIFQFTQLFSRIQSNQTSSLKQKHRKLIPYEARTNLT